MQQINEGFKLVRNNEKILDYKITALQNDLTYTISLNNEKKVELKTGDKEVCNRFIISELRHALVSRINLLKTSDIEAVPYVENCLFVIKAVRCQHTRPKGALRGEICNKLLLNSFASSSLGGHLFCPRCQHLSYI